MKISEALVKRKELIVKKNALETRLVEAQGYKVHLETKEVMDQIYNKEQFDAMLAEAEQLRTDIANLKKAICKANQVVPSGFARSVQDRIIEIGTLKDQLALLGQLRGQCRESGYGREEGTAKRTVMDAGTIDALIDSAQNAINSLNKEITAMNFAIDIKI